jgi:glycerol-1-phosphate dehydrogenase [NAD(P)+]
LGRAADVLRGCFGDRPAALVADSNTWEAAGRRTASLLRQQQIPLVEPVILDAEGLFAEYAHVERLKAAFVEHEAVPVAVGSGTVNDLTKLASHLCGRAYMAVATAASMDGYTAFGASITRDESKETFACPAPRAVIADLDVVSRAPVELNVAGYGDLVAKVTAGADWIVASALEIEPIRQPAWSLVQDRLHDWIAEPAAVRRGDGEAVRTLTLGLLMTGFAMQSAQSSRPAAGAEHQFSHLWDMQRHTHHGHVPYHGCKVAVGMLAVTLLYEHLLQRNLDRLPIAAIGERWPSLADRLACVEQSHGSPHLRRVALTESRAKYVDRAVLTARLQRLRDCWPDLQRRLAEQLIPSPRLVELFERAGLPSTPSAIGITGERLRRSFFEAQQIRRRYTVLDLAFETGLLESSVDAICPCEATGKGPGRERE